MRPLDRSDQVGFPMGIHVSRGTRLVLTGPNSRLPPPPTCARQVSCVGVWGGVCPHRSSFFLEKQFAARRSSFFSEKRISVESRIFLPCAMLMIKSNNTHGQWVLASKLIQLLKKTLKRSLTHISSKDWLWSVPFLKGVQILIVRDKLCTADNEQKMMRRKYWCHSATAHQSLFCRHILTLGTWVQVIGVQPTTQPHFQDMFGSKLDQVGSY